MLDIPASVRAARARPVKPRSADLLHVDAVTSAEPGAFMRVLDLVRVHGGTPVVIDFRRRGISARLALRIDGLAGDGARLADRLRATVGVRAARAWRPPDGAE